jgi:excinuclease UvrABC nuclease subunit
MALVRQVIRFLDGEDQVLYERIWGRLEAAAQSLDFEKARRLRNDLHLLHQVVATQRALRDATERHTLLLVLPSASPAAVEVYLVAAGRLWAQLHGDRRTNAADLADRLAGAWYRLRTSALPAIDHASVDQTNILNRWLFRNWGHPAILPLDLATDPDWPTLAARALALTDEQLRTETHGLDEQSEERADVPAAIDATDGRAPGNGRSRTLSEPESATRRLAESAAAVLD